MKIVSSISAGAKVYHAPLRVVRIPFTQNASEKKTQVWFEAGDVIEDVRVKVVTNVAASTIDVGLDSTTYHNDPDGLIDGLSCANAGWPAVVDVTETTSSMGPMMQGGVDGGTQQADNEGGANRLLIREDAQLTYTTTAHAITGYIYVFYRSLDEGANA